ncbi:substrate-binding domain-containing protein [Vibrio sp.]|uniref:Autoinducer 2-binding periplasmic protein LuxP n=1 Tax=Vibrio viridaestus TaxID=2487322 RepID=A0A3N9TCH0_9VIBR|nr:substrate-binding domain-containing protein [Vibrio viridaestus]MDC0612151.1 substrate-binding domain-containing protein [Vibrio sp.]RQW61769.1 sugar ABC transporter substrate-binding protein [Vibrio viridaestus]
MSNNFCFRRLMTGLPVALLLSAISYQACAKFIAVSVSEEDNYRNLITKNIEEAVDRRGDDIYIDSAGGDEDFQYQQIQSYIKAGADAIIVLTTGNYEKNKRIVKLAETVPLIFLNVPPVEDLSKMPPKAVYVGSNEEESGTMQMEELAKLANYQGNVALMMGEVNHPAAKMRTLDVKNVMAKYPKMKLVKTESGNWARNQGYTIVKKWLSEGVDFKVLVANNDEMIIGGLMAIRDAGKDPKNYLTGGIDATKDALNEMEKGDLDVTVLQDAVGQGRTAVDVAYKLINEVPVDSIVWVPFQLVTPDNLSDYLK